MPLLATRDPPLLAALVLAAGPALADGAPSAGAESQGWGATSSRATVRLERSGEHPATVVFENRLTVGNPDEMAFTLAIEGMSVLVAVSMGDGDDPDVMTVSPPPGFEASPPSVEVDEDSTGRIEIRYLPMS